MANELLAVLESLKVQVAPGIRRRWESFINGKPNQKKAEIMDAVRVAERNLKKEDSL